MGLRFGSSRVCRRSSHLRMLRAYLSYLSSSSKQGTHGETTWSLHDPLKMWSLPNNGVMTPFLMGHGDSRHPSLPTPERRAIAFLETKQSLRNLAVLAARAKPRTHENRIQATCTTERIAFGWVAGKASLEQGTRRWVGFRASHRKGVQFERNSERVDE